MAFAVNSLSRTIQSWSPTSAPAPVANPLCNTTDSYQPGYQPDPTLSRPRILNRLAHLGYTREETSVINRFDTHLAARKEPEGLAGDILRSGLTDALGKKVLEAGAGYASTLSDVLGVAGDCLAGSVQNAHLLGAMGDYGDWRDQHPRANPQEIQQYVSSHIGHRGDPYTGLHNALSSGTLSLPDHERRAFMGSRPAILASMLEQAYQDMNKLYPQGWSLPDRSVTL